MSIKSRAILTLVFCCLCWSIAGVFTRHLEATKGFEVTFWRSFFCAITVALIITVIQKKNLLTTLKAMGWPGLFSGCMWALMFTCFMLAMTRTSTANTLLVSSLTPLFAAVLGWVVLGTRVRIFTWSMIALALVGIWWMIRTGISREGFTGMAIALGVPIGAAINIVVLKKVKAHVDLAPAVLIGGLFSALVTAPLSMPFAATNHDIGILALLGIIQLAIPCMIMVNVVKHLAPQQVALLCLLEVILGPIWSWAFAGEALSAATIQGAAIVIAALASNEYYLSKSTRPPEPPETAPLEQEKYAKPSSAH
jgi:drug/metabolite transporter (DMT)-like permease